MVFEMPIFGSSQFDKLAEKATNESNINEDWQSILECCDYINAQFTSRPIEYLRSIMRRMSHNHPNVSIQAVILLDACVSNCGKRFHLEVASREFLTEARKLLEKGHPKVVERFKLMIKKWSENEFKSDPELSFIPSFYAQLMKEGYDFNDPTKPQLPKDPNVVISDQEEEDIIKALELSMKDVKGSSYGNSTRATTNSNVSTSLYPNIQASMNNDSSNRTTNQTNPVDAGRNGTTKKGPFKVKALYDFEAVDDNELTFNAGEVILVSDDRDENWWSGSNHRGEGLFPANFVTTDLNLPIADPNTTSKSVQFDDQVKVKFLEEEIIEIDEEKIDRLSHLIHEADPTGVTPDSDELIMLEDQCGKMGKLINKELERLDRIQVALNTANRMLTESMKEFLYLNQ